MNEFGFCGTGFDGNNYLNDFYKFDPVANVWTKTTSVFPGTKRSEAVAFAIGNRGYIGTGFDGTDGLAGFTVTIPPLIPGQILDIQDIKSTVLQVLLLTIRDIS